MSAAVVVEAASEGGISAVSNAGDTVSYKYTYILKYKDNKTDAWHVTYFIQKSKRKHILQ